MLVLGVAAVVVFRVFFVWPIRVPTGAMMNTILPGDHLLVHRSFGSLDRGDIVVFQHEGSPEYFVARVIGLPGETIQVQGKTISINGAVLDEERVIVETSHNVSDPLQEISTESHGPYRVYYAQRSSEDDDGALPDDAGEFGTTTPFQIPAGSYFIMGDNRDNSHDSRFRGAVSRDLIWGKPSIIYYSVVMPGESEFRTDRAFKRVQ
jgi:signal peptidase I